MCSTCSELGQGGSWPDCTVPRACWLRERAKGRERHDAELSEREHRPWKLQVQSRPPSSQLSVGGTEGKREKGAAAKSFCP